MSDMAGKLNGWLDGQSASGSHIPGLMQVLMAYKSPALIIYLASARDCQVNTCVPGGQATQSSSKCVCGKRIQNIEVCRPEEHLGQFAKVHMRTGGSDSVRGSYVIKLHCNALQKKKKNTLFAN